MPLQLRDYHAIFVGGGLHSHKICFSANIVPICWDGLNMITVQQSNIDPENQFLWKLIFQPIYSGRVYVNLLEGK